MNKKDFLNRYIEAEKRMHLKKKKAADNGEIPIIEAETAQLMQHRAEVLAAIESAPEPMMRTILEARYINGMKFEDIGTLTGYSVDNVYIIHRKALKQMTFPAYVE